MRDVVFPKKKFQNLAIFYREIFELLSPFSSFFSFLILLRASMALNQTISPVNFSNLVIIVCYQCTTGIEEQY